MASAGITIQVSGLGKEQVAALRKQAKTLGLSTETYVKRLTKLEEIASGFPGVERSFAIQAGREVRIVVLPEAVDDARAAAMSEEIARKIEGELQYPGQIKVVVIRETRAVGFAR